MKQRTLLCLAAACLVAAAQAQTDERRFSVLGDSYSTFAGHISPAWNASWYAESYPAEYGRTNDVTCVDSTWWKRLDATPGYRLDTNNSWSGSTVCLTGYRGEDYSDRAFVTRACNLGNPDIIFIFGGTNDYWANVPLGDFIYSGWTKRSLYGFRPAFARLVSQLQALYPDADIVNITNTGLGDAITCSMAEICTHYGILNVCPPEIDKLDGHPSAKGMRQIHEAVIAAMTHAERCRK